ncbi:RNase P modulator RnpM [Clostridium sp. DL1XJH146]
MKKRKIPMRMCTGCMEMKPKKDLIRVVKNKEEEISIDLKGKKPGRGAYICKDINCLEKAIKQKRIERNLGISITPDLLDELKLQISECNEK